MICTQCQFENLTHATYCSGCGKKLPQQRTKKALKETISDFIQTYKLKLIISITLTLLLGGTLFYYFSRPSTLDLVTDAYHVEDLETFNALKGELTTSESNNFESHLMTDALEIYDLFLSDAIYYKEAIRRLEIIESFVLQTDEISVTINQIDELYQSRIAYTEGRNWIEAKEWANAEAALKQVIPNDPNYDSALQYLEAITRWQLQDIAAQANEYLSTSQYDLAIAEVEKGLLIDPENEILINLMSAIELAQSTPSEEESEDNESSNGLGTIIRSGLDALGNSIESFFDGLFFGN